MGPEVLYYLHNAYHAPIWAPWSDHIPEEECIEKDPDTVVFEEYDIEESHQGFLHSMFGLATATVFTGVYLAVVLLLIDLLALVPLVIFLVAYVVGALLHLLEDNCTKTGIQWTHPFQDWEIRGDLTTTARRRDTVYQDAFWSYSAAPLADSSCSPP